MFSGFTYYGSTLWGFSGEYAKTPIFTHMIDVPGYHNVGASRRDYEVPFPLEEGTLHHVFDGGWLWVIPFNNHGRSTNPVVSVGLMLDPRQHPSRDDLSPEAEFFAFLEHYPAIAAQFEGARAVREWVRTPRIQYGSQQVVGDRWALLGHAAGFVDPLYSKGLYNALTAMSMLAHLLLKARETGDHSAATFAPLETLTQNYLRTNDRLIANSYRAFKHPDLWRVYSVLWLLGAYTEYVQLVSMRTRAGDDRNSYYDMLAKMRLTGGGFVGFHAVADCIDSLIEQVDTDAPGDVARVVEQASTILRTLSWIPDPFVAVLDGAVTLPRTKLRLDLLRQDRGFMRSGHYRQHFFGDSRLFDLLTAFLAERVQYSEVRLRYQRWCTASG